MYSLATACILLSRTVLLRVQCQCASKSKSLDWAHTAAALTERVRESSHAELPSESRSRFCHCSCSPARLLEQRPFLQQRESTLAHILSGTRSRARALSHTFTCAHCGFLTFALASCWSPTQPPPPSLYAVVVVFWNDSGPYNKPAAQPANQSETRWVCQRTDV